MKDKVMYLDIDDTLLVWTNKYLGFAAPKADEFMKWALEHFEVRWLTMWCPSGKMREAGALELEYRFNNTISAQTFIGISNPKSFIMVKTEGVDFDDPRPWVWVEDTLLSEEKFKLQELGLSENFYRANVTENMMSLQAAWRRIANRFSLPSTPTPFSKTMIVPEKILSDEEMMEKFRNNKMQNHDANRPPELRGIQL